VLNGYPKKKVFFNKIVYFVEKKGSDGIGRHE
jgi:hypothetical protein